MLIAPTRGLRDQRPVDRIRQAHETLRRPVPLRVLRIPVGIFRIDIERPAAGEILMQPVPETDLELRVRAQAAIDLGHAIVHVNPVGREI